MRISPKGLDFIKSFESFVPYVYDDLRPPVNGKYREWKGETVRGTLTIGYGHTNAAKHPLKIKLGLTVTEQEATDILAVDLDECEAEVERLVKVELTQGQFDALCSFNFNCGAGNLKKLIVPLNKGDYKTTRAKFDLYVKSKGQTLRGLQRRRDGEQLLWDDDTPPLPDEPVHHPAEVEKEHEPIKIGPVGTGGAIAAGGAAVQGAQVAIDAVTPAAPSAPVPAPPQAVTDTISNVGAWKGAGETIREFGRFAYHEPYLVGAIVLTVLVLIFGPSFAKRMGWA